MAARKDPTPSDYVRHVRESTRKYEKDLLAENERLAGLLSAAASDRARLQGEVDGLRAQLERHQEIERELNEQMDQVETNRHELAKRFLSVEEANSDLANLYVASYALHRSLERSSVLAAIHEVIINLVGSEEFAIFERDRETDRFVVSSSLGLSPEQIAALNPPTGNVLATLRDGSTYLHGEGGSESQTTLPGGRLTASFPLWVGERVHGAVAIFRLLQHKAGLEPVDSELFDLLATHAASSLYCCELHARSRQREIGP